MENVFIDGTAMLRVSKYSLTLNDQNVEDLIRKGLKIGEDVSSDFFMSVPVEVHIEILPYNLGLTISNSEVQEEFTEEVGEAKEE